MCDRDTQCWTIGNNGRSPLILVNRDVASVVHQTLIVDLYNDNHCKMNHLRVCSFFDHRDLCMSEEFRILITPNAGVMIATVAIYLRSNHGEDWTRQ